MKELKKRTNGLIIEKIVDKKEEQQIFTIQLVLKNHTRQDKKTQT